MRVLCSLMTVALFTIGGTAAAEDGRTSWSDAPWPSEPASEIRIVRDPDGREVKVYKNEWGYEVHDYGGGKVTIEAPRNLVEAPGPGKPPAEHYRKQGYVFIDRQTGDSLRRIGSCEYEIQYTRADGAKQTRVEQLGCLTDPEVRAAIEPNGDEGFRYEYTVRNGAEAKQAIRMVQLDVPSRDVVASSSGAQGWTAEIVDRSETRLNVAGETAAATLTPAVAWSPAAAGELLIPPKGNVSGLSVTSLYLPGLTESLVFGAATNGAGTDEEPLPAQLDAARRSLVSSSDHLTRTTIGPQMPPPGDDAAARLATVDRLLRDLDGARAAGLLEDAKADELRGLLTAARAGVFDSSLLEKTASQIQGMRGIEESYQRAVVTVLKALAASWP